MMQGLKAREWVKTNRGQRDRGRGAELRPGWSRQSWTEAWLLSRVGLGADLANIGFQPLIPSCTPWSLKIIHRMFNIQRVNPNVNHGLYLLIMYHYYWLIDCNKCTTPVQDAYQQGELGWARGYMPTVCTFCSIFLQTKTAKKKSLLIKNGFS